MADDGAANTETEMTTTETTTTETTKPTEMEETGTMTEITMTTTEATTTTWENLTPDGGVQLKRVSGGLPPTAKNESGR